MGFVMWMCIHKNGVDMIVDIISHVLSMNKYGYVGEGSGLGPWRELILEV
jgi:hypothetical protein